MQYGICTYDSENELYTLSEVRFTTDIESKEYIQAHSAEFAQSRSFLAKFSSDKPNEHGEIFAVDWHSLEYKAGKFVDISMDKGVRHVKIAPALREL